MEQRKGSKRAMVLSTEIKELEESLWDFDKRFDLQLMDKVFAVDLFEFGRSGKRYARHELLPDGGIQQGFEAKLHDLKVQILAPTVALVTYVSELKTNNKSEWSNRSSAWHCGSGSWKLRFHQGTPLELEKNLPHTK